MALKEEFEREGNWLFKHRSILPVSILLIALLVFTQTALQTKIMMVCSQYVELIFLSVSLIGLGIRIYTVGHTPKNTSGRNTHQGQVADSLNTTGIYSIVRHPLYLGNFFMWLGPALLTENLWFVIAFILFYWLYYERIMFAEEQFLERKFGEKYTSWANQVPAFIPRFSQFKQPAIAFSLKKVLQKEKTGLFLLFLIFALFDLIGEWLKSHTHFNYFLIVGSLLTMFLYIVLKFIKSKTALLNEKH